jgi:NaMN:DMB phosphoribosyltransferase
MAIRLRITAVAGIAEGEEIRAIGVIQDGCTAVVAAALVS